MKNIYVWYFNYSTLGYLIQFEHMVILVFTYETKIIYGENILLVSAFRI